MRYYADLHLHSHYSRATSKDLDLEHLSLWAQKKGIDIVGTADCIHPAWLPELQDKLTPAEDGLFELKATHAAMTDSEVPGACTRPVRFMLTVEISNIYKKDGKVRKVHNVLVMPSFAAAEYVQARLERIGNIRSDGRPILGLDSRDLLEIVLESDPRSFLIPAHIWTPWFSALGSKGGFDSIDHCFGDLADEIFAVETGLSSDPPMNWRISALDRYALVSHSDAHSPGKLGREATEYDTDFSYEGLYRALKGPDRDGLLGTIEFFPEEGKYHFDGHRKCQARLHPQEALRLDGRCPVCGKPVTIGVMARVEELADREEGYRPPDAKQFTNLIPLPEVIADAMAVGAASKKVQGCYHQLLHDLGDEFHILRDAPIEDIARVSDALIAEGIRRMRAGEVEIAAGYDGEYGTIRLFKDDERLTLQGQTSLFAAADIMVPAAPVEQEPAPPPSVEETGEGDLDESTNKPANTGKAALNTAQAAAVAHTDGHLLIVAGPGTGKTHTLVRRIIRLVKKLDEQQRALAITFTNKAAAEMAERLERVDGRAARRVQVGTFHRFCGQQLRMHGASIGIPEDFRIASEKDRAALAEIVWPQSSAGERRERLDALALAKNGLDWQDQAPSELVDFVDCQRQHGFLDFDDLQLEMLRLLRTDAALRAGIQARFPYLFVDEYQDINGIQHELLRQLVGPQVQITAIGDPNQAIYGFRGSDWHWFACFADTFDGAQILHLTENYRSTAAILQASTEIIAPAAGKEVPPLRATVDGEGSLALVQADDEREEAAFVADEIERLLGGTSLSSFDSERVASHADSRLGFADIAILYRVNGQRGAVEAALNGAGIPWQHSGARALVEEPVVDTASMLLRLARGEAIPSMLAANLISCCCPGFGRQSRLALQNRWLESGVQQVNRDDIRLLTGDTAPVAARFREAIVPMTEWIATLADCPPDEPLAALDLLANVPPLAVQLERDDHQLAWQTLTRRARAAGSLAELIDDVALQQANDGLQTRVERVSLLTMHAAKGLEFPVVFVIGCEDHLLPLHRDPARPDEVDEDEERRLAYVAMTRAQRHLYLLHASERTWQGQTRKRRLSPFIDAISDGLLDICRACPHPRTEAIIGMQHSLFD